MAKSKKPPTRSVHIRHLSAEVWEGLKTESAIVDPVGGSIADYVATVLEGMTADLRLARYQAAKAARIANAREKASPDREGNPA